MNSTIVIIPTYDEKDNVRTVSEAIFEAAPDVNILFVDDNSPDGTGKILDKMAAKDKRIEVIHKESKLGLGRAYISGFKETLKKDYKLIISMDSDLSHNPIEIPNLIKASENADLILGSRYIDGIRIINWPLNRLILSKMASLYIRTITGIPIADPTGGYRCYKREALEAIDLESIMSNGYSFLVEMSYRIWMKGFKLKEIPITFEDRRSGYSKLSMHIFFESLWIVWKLSFQHGFRRSPKKQKETETLNDKK